MKILMLVNWKIEYTDEVPKDRQPPDYYIKGKPYWFFRYFRNSEELQVDVVDIRSFPWLEKLEQNKLRFYVWQTLKCIPRLDKYDLILSHGMQSGIVLCLLRRIFGKGHYKHIVFDIGAFNSGREEGHALKLMQFASKSLDGVIYHTAVQEEYYRKCHPWLMDKAEFITFGTDADYFGKQKYADDGKEKKPYILCVGYYKRDWDTLIKAYEGVSTDMNLRLIGNGGIKTENPHIEVLDKVSITELKRQIANAGFCVLPLKSFNYSYGQMTLLQQMAMGKAVIAADVPSIKAYIKENAFILYEPQNSRMLGEKMQELSDDPGLCRKIGSVAQQAVTNIFNEKNMALDIERVIGKIMEGKQYGT